MAFLQSPTPEMVSEIRKIDSYFQYWESKGFEVGWLNGNAAVLRWYASYVTSGRPRGSAGFNNGLRISLKASLLKVVPRSMVTVISINGDEVQVSNGVHRSKGSGLYFTLDEGKKIVRRLNDNARLIESNFRFRLTGNQKIRKRGFRYLARYEIEFPEIPDFISIDSFDSQSAFESFHYSDSPDVYHAEWR